jgi:hypothetical protein
LEVSGALIGVGASTLAGAVAPPWLPAGKPPASRGGNSPLALRPSAGAGTGRAGATVAGWRPSFTFSAPAIDSSNDGSAGSGTGESSGQPGWAKIATSARPAAAVSPSKAKVVLRIRSGNPSPAKLGGRRAETSLLWRRELTCSCIGHPPPGRKRLD